MSDKCVDLSFRLNAQAMAVAQLLAGREPVFADYENGYLVEIDTWPWYNGRERGIVIVMCRSLSDADRYCWVIVENRSSDNIMVEEWVQNFRSIGINGPSLLNREEALGDEETTRIYEERKCFDYGKIGEVADYVYDRMAEAYKDAGRKPAIVRVAEGAFDDGRTDEEIADEMNTTVAHVAASRALGEAIAAGDPDAIKVALDNLNNVVTGPGFQVVEGGS